MMYKMYSYNISF